MKKKSLDDMTAEELLQELQKTQAPGDRLFIVGLPVEPEPDTHSVKWDRLTEVDTDDESR